MEDYSKKRGDCMTIGERLKALRKELDITQQKFAEKIGTTQNNIANYEIGRRNPSAAAINNICKTFNVNEDWLRSGEGEMFAETNDSVLAELAAEYSLEGEKLELIRNFLMLTLEQQDIIVQAAIVIAEANKKAAAEAAKKEAAAAAEEKTEPPAAHASDVDTPEELPPDPDIEAEVSKFRAKMYARKKAQTSMTSLFTEDSGTKKDPPR